MSLLSLNLNPAREGKALKRKSSPSPSSPPMAPAGKNLNDDDNEEEDEEERIELGYDGDKRATGSHGSCERN